MKRNSAHSQHRATNAQKERERVKKREHDSKKREALMALPLSLFLSPSSSLYSLFVRRKSTSICTP